MNKIDVKRWIWPANIIRGCLVGALTGPFIALFANSIFYLTEVNIRNPFLFLLLPLGALFTHWTYKKLGTVYRQGTVIAIDNINELHDISPNSENLAKSQMPKAIGPIMGIVCFINTCITHLLGASGGKEGAGVQIGLSVASVIERGEERLFIRSKEHNPHGDYYLMCGASAAFGALFNAPVAGILFGTQFASPKTTRLDAYLPCIFSSYIAVIISQLLKIHTLEIPSFETLPFSLQNILITLVFALFIGAFSRLFCYSLKIMKKGFAKITKNKNIQILLPSSLLMILALLLFIIDNNFDYNGLGSHLLYKAFEGDINPYSFLIKSLAISLTFAACFTGGEVVPLLVIGGTLGSTIASLFGLPIAAFTALGAIGMLSGGTNLPLVCFALGFELFGYNEPKLLFLASAIAFVASGKDGIYKHQKKPY